MSTLTGMFRASKQSSSTFMSVLYFGLGAVTSAGRLKRRALVLAHAHGGFDLRERFTVGVDVAVTAPSRVHRSKFSYGAAYVMELTLLIVFRSRSSGYNNACMLIQSRAQDY
ncbi:hypothetical protein KC19_7G116600 [Ceratodon purpureus]|uniref:Uncharacterized protein n=1 Tax=Ceratodon purpureus TaxID=3225 RepID=A0A8T0HAH0_CERPU|nr:hypothetical protein KC19_7G116600 [Ceratodon purpureus]